MTWHCRHYLLQPLWKMPLSTASRKGSGHIAIDFPSAAAHRSFARLQTMASASLTNPAEIKGKSGECPQVDGARHFWGNLKWKPYTLQKQHRSTIGNEKWKRWSYRNPICFAFADTNISEKLNYDYSTADWTTTNLRGMKTLLARYAPEIQIIGEADELLKTRIAA